MEKEWVPKIQLTWLYQQNDSDWCSLFTVSVVSEDVVVKKRATIKKSGNVSIIGINQKEVILWVGSESDRTDATL